MKSPFNAAVVALIADELQALAGGQIQRIAQPQPLQIVMSIFKSGIGEKHLLIDVSPQFYRVHLTTHKLPNPPSPSPFCMTLRKYLHGGNIVGISQRGGDRILDVQIQSEGAVYLLSAELMGKHANLILVSPDGKILHAAKLITARQSRVREVLPGCQYSPPPVPGVVRKDVALFQNSAVLDEHYALAQENAAYEQRRSGLLGVLRKLFQQKSRALAQVRQGAQESTRADEFQKYGDLILSQLHTIGAGANQAELTDYYAPDATKIGVPLNPDLSPQENAQRYFHKARRARESAAELHRLQQQLETETVEIEKLIFQVEAAPPCPDILALFQEVEQRLRAKNWLRIANGNSGRAEPASSKPEFGGFKIKRFTSPDGFEILVGESATANDYLVTRLSQTNDWWLHLRGGTSSHAIIKTNNAPDRVPPGTLLFAARLVIARSVAKHAGWAEVDYTLRKYVRKPRKAAPGSVVITNQKTLRVEPEKK